MRIDKETNFQILKQSEPLKATIFDERTKMLTMWITDNGDSHTCIL